MSNSEVVVHFIALILVKYLVILRYQPIRLMQETYSPFILLCATNSGQNYIAYIPLSPLITTKKGGLFSYSAILYEICQTVEKNIEGFSRRAGQILGAISHRQENGQPYPVCFRESKFGIYTLTSNDEGSSVHL